MLSVTSLTSVRIFRQGSCLLPRAFSQGVTAVFIMEKLGWGGVWEEETFHRGRESRPSTLLPQHNVWHTVGAQQMLAE